MKLKLTLLLMLSALLLQAQPGKSSLGLRAGGVSGITFKYVDDELRGFELIAGAKEGGMVLTCLLQKYRPIGAGRISGLSLYTGGGAHAGYSKYTEEIIHVVEGWHYHAYHEVTSPVLGGDFVLGVEYQFESIPMNLSLDYKPYVEVFGQKDFRVDLWDIGFSIRYAFNQ